MKKVAILGGITVLALATFLIGLNRCSAPDGDELSGVFHGLGADLENKGSLLESETGSVRDADPVQKQQATELRYWENIPNRIPSVPAPRQKLELESVERLGLEGNTPSDDIAQIFELLSIYKQVIKSRNVPIGVNEDLVLALIGKNPQQIEFLPRDHPSINENGLLIDEWDTPYHFHLQSSDDLEIRSAGPDFDLFTSDDIVRSIKD